MVGGNIIANFPCVTFVFEHVVFQHIFREGNQVVDRLAKLGPFMEDIKVWMDPHNFPYEIRAMFNKDT